MNWSVLGGNNSIINLQSHTHSETLASNCHSWNVMDEAEKRGSCPWIFLSNLGSNPTRVKPSGRSEGTALVPGGWQLPQQPIQCLTKGSGSFTHTFGKHGVSRCPLNSLGLVHWFCIMEGRCVHPWRNNPTSRYLSYRYTYTCARWYIGRHICATLW